MKTKLEVALIVANVTWFVVVGMLFLKIQNIENYGPIIDNMQNQIQLLAEDNNENEIDL